MGKGSKRRPAAVDERTLEQRWASINWNSDSDDEPDPPAPEDPTIRTSHGQDAREG